MDYYTTRELPKIDSDSEQTEEFDTLPTRCEVTTDNFDYIALEKRWESEREYYHDLNLYADRL